MEKSKDRKALILKNQDEQIVGIFSSMKNIFTAIADIGSKSKVTKIMAAIEGDFKENDTLFINGYSITFTRLNEVIGVGKTINADNVEYNKKPLQN
jgi:hypothetical protein